MGRFNYQRKKNQNNSKVATYYRAGNRYISVLHARIRNTCSNSLSDLYINHLLLIPTCSCSEEVEDAEHYFCRCSNFRNEKETFFLSTSDFQPLNIYILLFGDKKLTTDENTSIFKAVETFIKDTRRFTD